MSLNRIFKAEEKKLNVLQKAEQYLGLNGVTRLLPDLWDAVQFEMNSAAMMGEKWGHRKLAQRYLSFLRDRVGASSLSHAEDEQMARVMKPTPLYSPQKKVAGQVTKRSGA